MASARQCDFCGSFASDDAYGAFSQPGEVRQFTRTQIPGESCSGVVEICRPCMNVRTVAELDAGMTAQLERLVKWQKDHRGAR